LFRARSVFASPPISTPPADGHPLCDQQPVA
jgi:hypothetical protein